MLPRETQTKRETRSRTAETSPGSRPVYPTDKAEITDIPLVQISTALLFHVITFLHAKYNTDWSFCT